VIKHTEEFHHTLHRQLLNLHRTLAVEKVLVGLGGSYAVLLSAVRECLDDLADIIHPHDTLELDGLVQEQKALAKEVTTAVAWVNEEISKAKR